MPDMTLLEPGAAAASPPVFPAAPDIGEWGALDEAITLADIDPARQATLRRVLRGDPLSDGPAFGLARVVEGLAAVVDARTGLCLHLVGAGEAFAASDAGDPSQGASGFWMTDGAVLVTDRPTGTGVTEPEGLGSVTTVLRANRAAMAAEFVCSVRHPAAPRLARWLLRLFAASGEPSVTLNQADLGVMSGLQRTSVCAAMSRLQATGGLKVTRGRIKLLDRSALVRIACRCGHDADAPDPARAGNDAPSVATA